MKEHVLQEKELAVGDPRQARTEPTRRAAVVLALELLVARAVGAGDKREAERVAKQSLMLAVLIALVVGVATFLSADLIVPVMGATESVNASASGFLRIISLFSIVMGVMFIGGGTLRGAGDTFTPMWITGFINVINVVLGFGFIFGNFGFPRLGPLGSAAAGVFIAT